MTSASPKPIVSIIIDNYNYGRFVAEAIQSALDQTWPSTEVIVVDDGSTDDSAAAIAAFRRDVVAILKPNRGQGSAFNAGFRRCHGDIVIFLDADDRLLPAAASTAAEAFSDPALSRAYWPMRIIGERGEWTGGLTNQDLPEGDLSALVRSGGPYMYHWSSTSGNAWARSFLEAALPIPEAAFTNYVDNYLSALSPLYGTHRALAPLACWRNHQLNETKHFQRSAPFLERLALWLEKFESCLEATQTHCTRLGLAFNAETWKTNSWFHRMHRAVAKIEERIPDGVTMILADADRWQTQGYIRNRRALPFLEKDGQYWGRPASESVAITELGRMVGAGARYLALPWTHFWWCDTYPGLMAWLADRSIERDETDDVQIFRLAE